MLLCYLEPDNQKTQTLKRCGYEGPGMILLLYLKGAMLLERSKDKSVHVRTCICYDFKALWKLWR